MAQWIQGQPYYQEDLGSSHTGCVAGYKQTTKTFSAPEVDDMHWWREFLYQGIDKSADLNPFKKNTYNAYIPGLLKEKCSANFQVLYEYEI